MMESSSDPVQGIWQNAVAQLMAGMFSGAAKSFKTLLAAHPDSLDALHLLAVTFYKDNSLEQALPLFRRAVSANPTAVSYHTNSAVALLEAGQVAEALRSTVIALVIDPGDAEALVNHAGALREDENDIEATIYARRAIARQPDSSYAHSTLGQALSQQSLFLEANPSLTAAVLLDPGNPRAYFVLGQNYNALGLPGAESRLINALRIKPGQARYLTTLAATHKFTRADDEWLTQLRAVETGFIQRPMSYREAAPVAFALGKALTDIGEKSEGFSYLVKANGLKRHQVSYDETITLPMFETSREIFSPAFIRERSGLGDPSNVPIFIVGMPRSGTTLVEQILASHTEVYGAGELPFFGKLVDTLDGRDAMPFPLTVPLVTERKLKEIGAAYLDEMRDAFGSQIRVTDKMPGNLAFAGLIHLALPNAKIIQVRRDLVDVCLSCFSINFANGLDYSYELAELGRYAYSSKRFIDHWEKAIPADRLFTVQYEALIEDQEGESRRLLEFCELPWEDACLSFYKTERAVKTASVLQVRKPIYKSSVGRWRPSPEILEPLTRALDGDGAMPAKIGTFWFDTLAEQALQSGEMPRARNLSKIATIVAPDSAQAWQLLGLAQHLIADNTQALVNLARANVLMKGVPHFRNNLGTVRRELGDLAGAGRDYRAALCLAPAYADALYNIGNVQRQLEDLHSAENSYLRALRLNPDSPESWAELSATLIELGRAVNARDAAQTALSYSSGLATAHFHSACASDLSDDVDGMRMSLRRAIICDPAFHQAWMLLGTERSEIGDQKSAIRLLRRALLINPNSAEAWYNLSSVITFTSRSDDFEEIGRVADQAFEHQPVKSKILMHFALGKAFGDLGDHRRAYEQIANGNRMKRDRLDYDVSRDEEAMRLVAQIFTRENFAEWSAVSSPIEDAPIFILGMPRSGTSLVEQILGALPGTIAGGELSVLPDSILWADSLIAAYPHVLADDDRRMAYLTAVASAYKAGISRFGLEEGRLLDKLPGNFLFAGLILLAFPDARIVHCRRDPLAVCWSCYSMNFAWGHEYCYDQAELGRYYRAYDALAQHWREILPRERYREVSYESLVSNSVSETRELAEFCGLAWTESSLDFHRQGRRTRTASQQQIRQPIYRTAIDKWKQYEPFLTPLISSLKPAGE